MEQKEITIYGDGACIGNPGQGGYGTVLLYGPRRKELSAGFVLTTNNRMELLAIIVGLEALKESCKVTIYSDSKYLVNSMTLGWTKRWEALGWQRDGEPVTNRDLWQRLLSVAAKHQVTFEWVKGHAGNTENERCDELARQAANQTPANLLPDAGYTKTNPGDPVSSPTQQMTLDLKVAKPVRQSTAATTPTAATKPEKPGQTLELEAVILPDGGKQKVAKVGQPCRKCSTPVIKKTPKRKELKPGQTYYYSYYLHCPACSTMYLVEDAKVTVDPAK